MTLARLNPTARCADAKVFNGVVHAVEIQASKSNDIFDQTQSMLAEARPVSRETCT